MIYFPGFGLSFKVDTVAFHIGGIEIYWYAICIVLGIALAVLFCKLDKNNFGVPFDFVFETLIFAILFGVMGARIYYVLFNWQYYALSPFKIFHLRDGGLAIYGGLIVGGLVIAMRCKRFKVSCKDLLDYIIPFVALAQSIGRWGNFFNREAYGTESLQFFRMGITTQEGYQEVHPAFLYESIATMGIFILLRMKQKNRKFKGEICYWYLFLYGGIRMMIEGVRIDSLMLGNFRISQILSGAIFVVFGIMLLKKYRKYLSKKDKRQKWEKKATEK